MIRMMQWILLAGTLFLITPELSLAREQAPQDRQVQSADQPEQYTDIQQMELEKLRGERANQQMEASYKAAKYYALLSIIAFAITILAFPLAWFLYSRFADNSWEPVFPSPRSFPLPTKISRR